MLTSEAGTADRLVRLRQALGLTQRELARELRVSAGAIGFWESGSRPVPGPVLKLLEIYELHLGEGRGDRLDELELREVASRWTDRLVTAARPRRSSERESLRRRVAKAVTGYLSRDLSREQVKRAVQLAFAERIVEALGKAKGLPMKVAQAVSYVDLGFPPEVSALLESLQSSSPPMASSVAARVIYEELGKPPQELFDAWSPRPFAAASLGQVHAARLASGEEVAVKVQYPGVRDSLVSDFRGLSALEGALSLLGSRTPGLLDEIRGRVVDECDYLREAAMQERFRRFFSDEPALSIARVHEPLTTSRVLVQERLRGETLRKFGESAPAAGRDRAGAALMRFVFRSLFELGLIQSDMHAGNFLFDGERVACLDFGRALEVAPEIRRSYREFFLAIIGDQPGRAERALRAVGAIEGPEGGRELHANWHLQREVNAHFLPRGRFRFSPQYARDRVRLLQSFRARSGVRVPPAFFWPFCMQFALWSLLGELGAEADWNAESLAILDRVE